MSEKSIIFAGTPDFAKHILAHIQNHHPNLVTHIISQPDKPRGRGRKSSPSPVKEFGISNTIPTSCPKSKEELSQLIKKLNPDLILVVAYGMILPKNITDTFLCVNIHASLLPRHRGASPIQASLLSQDSETGITLIQMNEKMDEGDMILRKSIPILETDNFGTLYNKLVTLGSNLAEDFITGTLSNKPFPRTKQNHNKASYCSKLSKENFEILPTDTIQTKLAKIKAFSPYPGAFIKNDQNQPIKILNAALINSELIPIKIKPPGKPEMAYKDYCLGHPEGLKL